MRSPQQPAAAAVSKPVVSLPAKDRELRIDLFRGLALWLIFIDHMSPDLLTWFTIRNYGFSDATEIFIFISGYTAAFVYGRAMLESGFLIGTARILRRVWQIYIAHVFLFTVFLAEIAYFAASVDNPLYSDEMGVTDFLKRPDLAIVQTLLLRFRPLNMDVLPLYIVLMFFLPYVLWLMKWRPDLTLALSVALYVMRWKYDLYLTAYPSGFWSFNPFAWQLLFVFGAWCALGGAKRLSRILSSPVTLWISFAYLLAAFGVTLTWYFPPAQSFDALPAGAMDLSDRQARSGHTEVRAFPGVGDGHPALRAQGLARTEIAMAAADDPVRAAFPADLLPRGVPGFRGVFPVDRDFRRHRSALPRRLFSES